MEALDPRFVAVVRRHLRYLPIGQDLESGALLKDLGLDSMAAVALLLDLEDEFACMLPDDKAIRDTFRTAGTLWAAVSSVRTA